jgi:hypothetical protein
MVKNVNYYATDASFGLKGIGYTKDVVGGGDPVEPKGKFKSSGYGDMPKAKSVKEGLNEAKRIPIATEMKGVEKTSEAVSALSKLAAIDEAIKKREAQLTLAESEELVGMIDKKMVKTLHKEIKELKKHEAKIQKIYEKMTGDNVKRVIDEDDEMKPC